ncbi:hypothetical protein BKI52_41135 [marine bacterium AO1-C]|nr:hypothetical protein BKI52_41135 [marine bacterium AO1-C]
MKKITLLLFACLLGGLHLHAQDKRLLVAEPNHSTIGFAIPIANLSKVTGKFTEYDLKIAWNENNPTQSTLEANIKVSSINTGISGRDKHLQSKMFFDAENHPNITFKSNKIEPKTGSKNEFVAYGAFTMRGVTKSVAIPFKYTGKSGKNTLGFSIRWSINRQVYGVGSEFKHTTMKEFLGNNVEIQIDFWTKKMKKK